MNKNTVKKPAWKIAVFILSLAAIVALWVRKDMAGQFAGLSLAEALPMLTVNIAVTAFKVALLSGLIILVKWISGRFRK